MDIVVCPSGGDIKLCPERDIELCLACPELFLEGDNLAAVNSEYTASGGIPPYTYSFDSGTISSAGVITSLDTCTPGARATGVVSVTDSCSTPQTVDLDVLLPGQYVEIRCEFPIASFNQEPCTDVTVAYDVFQGDVEYEGCGTNFINGMSNITTAASSFPVAIFEYGSDFGLFYWGMGAECPTDCTRNLFWGVPSVDKDGNPTYFSTGGLITNWPDVRILVKRVMEWQCT